MEAKPTLIIVIPVYNEAGNIHLLLNDWTPIWQRTSVPYRIIFIDDGSTDESLSILRKLREKNPALSVYTQENSGHGNAILKGYRLALDAEWIFQLDSDHQLDPAAFEVIWAEKKYYDFLLAERETRNASIARRCLSQISSLMVRLLYGGNITDVNSPYRLMRSTVLVNALEKIDGRNFAPNMLISAWFILKKKRIFKTVVSARKADGLRQSRFSLYFLRGALRSFREIILFRISV